MLLLIREILYIAVRVLDTLLLVYCVFSWFIRDPYNKFYAALCKICDPILAPFRALLSKISFLRSAPIDFSPVLLMLVLSMLLQVI